MEGTHDPQLVSIVSRQAHAQHNSPDILLGRVSSRLAHHGHRSNDLETDLASPYHAGKLCSMLSLRVCLGLLLACLQPAAAASDVYDWCPDLSNAPTLAEASNTGVRCDALGQQNCL